MDRRDPPPHDQTTAATRRRRKFPLGTIIALLSLALLAGLVWYLTRDTGKPATGAPGSGAPPAAAQGAPAGGAPGGRRGPPPTTVGVARAEKADIPVQLDALGTVSSPAAATVRAQVSGVLRKIHYTEGQQVKAGQLLAEIDPRPFEMALMQASGQRQRDEAQLDNARVLLKRYESLLKQDSIARQEVDTQAALVKQLEGTVMTDRAAEGNARLNLSYARVTAPISGRIGLRSVDLGNVVGPGDANGIAVITQLAPIDVVFSVPQDQLPELRQRLNAGEQLPVTAWDRGRTRQLASGRFLALDNQIDVQTGTARAKARFTNEESSLFPGQFVNIRLQMRTIADSVLIPVSALRHGSNGDHVYVLNAEQKTVALRNVQAGRVLDDKVHVLSGLAPGMQVITEGADRLRDGATVNLPGDRPAGRGMRPGTAGAAAAGNGAAPGGGEGRRSRAAGGEQQDQPGQPAADRQGGRPAAGADATASPRSQGGERPARGDAARQQ